MEDQFEKIRKRELAKADRIFNLMNDYGAYRFACGLAGALNESDIDRLEQQLIRLNSIQDEVEGGKLLGS